MMKHKPICFVLALLMAVPVFAQNIGDTLIGMPLSALYDPLKSKVPIWLDFSAGASFAESYDKGTIPFRYKGFGANAKGGVTIEWQRCQMNVEGQGFYTSLASVSGTVLDVSLSAEFLYHCSRIRRWSFWAGGSLQGFMDVKEIPALMNASSSVSLFGNLCATGMVQFDFAFIHDGSYNLRNLLTAYGKLNLPIAGVANRPGYAYIGNPTINDDAFLEGSETFAKFLLGASTELGLRLNLPNDNRIGLAYRWDYLSTGKKGTYRFDHALHAINLSFMFRIN